MTKSELIIAFAEDQNNSTKDAEKIINTIVNTMSSALINGENIELRGFGTFIVREHGSYVGLNPKTREQIVVKPQKLPFFKPCKELKDEVNQNKMK
jgi:integration host factor subunit beta